MSRSSLERIADQWGINHWFIKSRNVEDKLPVNAIACPVEAYVNHISPISGEDGVIIGKYGEELTLDSLLGNNQPKDIYNGGTYVNLYLTPLCHHFFVTPTDGEFLYTYRREPVLKQGIPLWMEFVGKIVPGFDEQKVFRDAIQKNAFVSTTYFNGNFPIAMAALGSWNIQAINMDYEHNKHYSRCTEFGYFSIGSAFLMLFPKEKVDLVIDVGQKLSVGEKIGHIH
jgi:phosphatidylserine decarboxylase